MANGIDFAALRAKKGGNMAALQKNLEKNGQGGYKKDERLWRPTPNKQNVCECIVRFLPIPKVDMEAANEGKILEEDLTPVATVMKHWFKGPTGKSYVEMSPKTFGEECPVFDHDIPLLVQTKNLGEKEKKQKRIELGLDKRNMRTERYANVLIVKDSTNPENEGKVMLWQYGAEIQKKIDGAQEKKFSDSVVFDPFCPWEGANLKLNLEFEEKTFNGNKVLVPDYKAATWEAPSVLGDDERINELWEQSHSIAAFMDRSQVKDYDTLQKKFFDVMDYDEEGNPKGSAKHAAKSADDMMSRMQMNAESVSKSAVDDKDAGVKDAGQSESAPEQQADESKAEPEQTGGGDDLSDFEDMLKNM